MNAEHTPGPWFAEMGSYGLEIESANASIASAWGEDKEAFANARLIAAAPDLLNACINALERLKDIEEQYPCHRNIIELRNAIAKALTPTPQ